MTMSWRQLRTWLVWAPYKATLNTLQTLPHAIKNVSWLPWSICMTLVHWGKRTLLSFEYTFRAIFFSKFLLLVIKSSDDTPRAVYTYSVQQNLTALCAKLIQLVYSKVLQLSFTLEIKIQFVAVPIGLNDNTVELHLPELNQCHFNVVLKVLNLETVVEVRRWMTSITYEHINKTTTEKVSW